VALAEAVGRIAMVEAGLKWPNDLLVGGSRVGEDGYGKCAGVLAEAVGNAVVLGIGLNVSQRAGELPPRDGTVAPATSLDLAGSVCTDRDPLLRATLRTLADWYGRWRSADGDPVRSGLGEAYREHCLTLGAAVSVALPGGEVVAGTAAEVDGDGRLVVATQDGPRSLAAGDVRHVR
jgi:BirA family biotin operon repressor/biotin-[acetyl-CoA-carboxylase] ligase